MTGFPTDQLYEWTSMPSTDALEIASAHSSCKDEGAPPWGATDCSPDHSWR